MNARVQPVAVAAASTSPIATHEITLDNERDTNPVLNAAAQNLQAGYGLLAWPALLRKLDRIDGSFAQ